MEDLEIPGPMEHFRVRMPAALIAAISAEAERASRKAGHRVTPSALVRAALSARFTRGLAGAAASLPSKGA
jgi:hypothetical protein